MVRVLQLENYESEDTNKTAFIRMSVEEAESPTSHAVSSRFVETIVLK